VDTKPLTLIRADLRRLTQVNAGRLRGPVSPRWRGCDVRRPRRRSCAEIDSFALSSLSFPKMISARRRSGPSGNARAGTAKRPGSRSRSASTTRRRGVAGVGSQLSGHSPWMAAVRRWDQHRDRRWPTRSCRPTSRTQRQGAGVHASRLQVGGVSLTTHRSMESFAVHEGGRGRGRVSCRRASDVE
jgi:hypothetical protein